MTADVQRVFRALQEKIASGKYTEDEPLPSLRTLAETHGVSVYAARQAVQTLVGRNLVAPRHGSGLYVTRKGAKRQIGLIIPGVAYSEFFRPMLARLIQLCEKGGYQPVVRQDWSASVDERLCEVRTFVQELSRDRVAGVVFQPLERLPNAPEVNQEIVAALSEAGIPIVLVNSDIVPMPERSRYDVVGINNFDAGVRVAEHLLSLGLRDIRFLQGKDADWNIRNRMRGVSGMVLSHGGTWTERNVLTCEPTDVKVLRSVIKSGTRPMAVICRGDATALELLKTLKKLGKRVPEDVRVVGFDDIAAAAQSDPPLTTIRQPSEAIADVAFRALVGRIAVPTIAPCEIYLPAPLVVRASTRS